MTSVTELVKRNSLSYDLTPISIRELLFINDTPCEIYGIEDGLFKRILKKNAYINKRIIRELIEQGQVHLFVYYEDRPLLIKYIQDALTHVTRSLSVGNPVEKAKRQMNLLTINMGLLYRNPTDDELLQLQYQSAKNLAYFLMNKVSIHETLYQEYIKQKHHFIYAQPLLSSLFVLGILKSSSLFTDKDVENIFITSYFKDIGMSVIPVEKYNKDDLNDEERGLLAEHAKRSVDILKGRLPLNPNHLNIIEHHHSFSLLTDEINTHIIGPDDDKIVAGFETMIVSVMDIVAAMISGRPFRSATTLYEALDLIKLLISEQYPQEFRMIVNYFRHFFSVKV